MLLFEPVKARSQNLPNAHLSNLTFYLTVLVAVAWYPRILRRRTPRLIIKGNAGRGPCTHFMLFPVVLKWEDAGVASLQRLAFWLLCKWKLELVFDGIWWTPFNKWLPSMGHPSMQLPHFEAVYVVPHHGFPSLVEFALAQMHLLCFFPSNSKGNTHGSLWSLWVEFVVQHFGSVEDYQIFRILNWD